VVRGRRSASPDEIYVFPWATELRYNEAMEPTVANYIEVRLNRRGLERPVIVGTRVRVQDIVSDYERHGLTVEEIAREFPQISLAQVHAALSYYFDHRDEIWNCLKEDAAYVEQVKQQQEETEQSVPDGKASDGNSVSS